MTPCGKPTPRGSCPLPASHSGRCLNLPGPRMEDVLLAQITGLNRVMAGVVAPTCSFPGCTSPPRLRGGLCRGHDEQRLRHRHLTPILPHSPGTVPIGVRVTDKTATMLDELGPTRGRAAKKVLERWANDKEGV